MLYPSVLCSVLSLEDQVGSCVFFILALIPFVSFFFFSVTFHSLEDLLSHGTKKCPRLRVPELPRGARVRCMDMVDCGIRCVQCPGAVPREG